MQGWLAVGSRAIFENVGVKFFWEFRSGFHYRLSITLCWVSFCKAWWYELFLEVSLFESQCLFLCQMRCQDPYLSWMQYQTLHLNRKAFTAVFSYYCPSFQKEWSLSFDSSVLWVMPFPCMPRKSCRMCPQRPLSSSSIYRSPPNSHSRDYLPPLFLVNLILFNSAWRCHPLPLWILGLLGPWLGKEFCWREERLVNDPSGTAGID